MLQAAYLVASIYQYITHKMFGSRLFSFVTSVFYFIEERIDCLLFDKKFMLLPISISDGKQCVDFDMSTIDFPILTRRRRSINRITPLNFVEPAKEKPIFELERNSICMSIV